MLYIVLLAVAITGYVLFQAYKDRRQFQSISAKVSELLHVNRDMHQTLELGIYYRFKKYDEEKTERETPLDFEYFVGKILEGVYGGQVTVTPSGGEQGVDIVHQRNNGTYFGQVKCYGPDHKVDYEAIALVHSNMVKYGADYGFVVTTSGFTAEAQKYAEGLNIDLIGGRELVSLWADSLDKQREFIPIEAI